MTRLYQDLTLDTPTETAEYQARRWAFGEAARIARELGERAGRPNGTGEMPGG